MSELSFLIELLLNHKLPKATKELIKTRITTIEASRPVQGMQLTRPAHQQAPSMQAAIEAMEHAGPVPVTQAAASALNDRQRLINKAVNSGPFQMTPEEGRTGPRKF